MQPFPHTGIDILLEDSLVQEPKLQAARASRFRLCSRNGTKVVLHKPDLRQRPPNTVTNSQMLPSQETPSDCSW